MVVVHYSLIVISDQYLTPWFRDKLANFDGLKVQFLQDEYRWVDAITDEMRHMGINLLYSVIPPDTVDEVYGSRLPDTEILPTLTGYVPEKLAGRPSPPLQGRPVDVGYRGRSLPYWLGRLGHEKTEIGRAFLEHCTSYGLRCDIEWTEGARIYGQRWPEFMESCRTMLASESGSSIVDVDGGAEQAVRSYLASRPTATFEEVEQHVLEPWSASPVVATVSPRIFEAAASRTGMVMFRGTYQGIVQPWEHYVPLEKDFSNIELVAESIRDDSMLQKLIERSHEDLIRSGAYSERAFVARFDQELAERARPKQRRGRNRPLRLQLEQLRTGRGYRLSRFYGLARVWLLFGLGARETLRHRQMRRLAMRARRLTGEPGALSVWDDLFRLAMLTSFQTGAITPAVEPFNVGARLETEVGQLTLISMRNGGPRGEASPALRSEVVKGLRDGSIRRIVWNHSTLDQYVMLRLPLVDRQIGFDVGRYDAYGVYNFERLATLALTAPDVVATALAPLLVPMPDRA